MSEDKQDDTSAAEDEEVEHCGLGPIRPAWCKRFENMKAFVAALTLGFFCYGAQNTYLSASLTTIEKAFRINSKKSGFLPMVNDIGYICTVVIVSFFARRAHKPKVIGIATMLIGFCGILCSTPYFIYGGDMLDESESQNADADAEEVDKYGLYCFNNRTYQCKVEKSVQENQRSLGMYCIFVACQLCIGFVMSPIWSYGVTFIDDNVHKHTTPIYMSCMFAIRTISPIVGYVIGGVFSKVAVNLQPTDLTPKDPQWVGAWWLGFLIFGTIMVICSFPLQMFPRKLPRVEKEHSFKLTGIPAKLFNLCAPSQKSKDKKAKNEEETEETLMSEMMKQDEPVNYDIKEFLGVAKRLATNKIWVLHLLASCFKWFSFYGTYIFLPKYVEKAFNKTAFEAGIVLGTAGALPATIAILISGILTSKLKMNSLQMIKFIVIFGVIASVLYTIFLGLACPPHKYHGFDPEHPENSSFSIMESCNQNCNCTDSKYSPVCADGETYFSACHAGCLTSDGEGNYGNCSCSASGNATHGYCESGCVMFYPFIIDLFFAKFIGIVGSMPGMMLLLRIIDPKDKAISIASYSFIGSIAALPSPIIFGAIIDSTCLLFDACNAEICHVYDIDLLRYRFHGMGTVTRTIGLCIDFLVWYLIWKQTRSEEKKKKSTNDDQNDMDLKEIGEVAEGPEEFAATA